MGPSKEIREGSARLLDAEAEIPEDRPRSQSLERVARNSESKRSDGEGGLSYQRSLDPLEANIYLDSLFGPLFYKLDRIRTEGKAAAGPRFSDYRLVSVFMLLNIFTQLSIAFKIYQVGDQTYGSIRDSLMGHYMLESVAPPGTYWTCPIHGVGQACMTPGILILIALRRCSRCPFSLTVWIPTMMGSGRSKK